MNTAAVILCAGKGTRMNDDSKNKVCFDCAGVPVIRRIIDNMKAAGIRQFVIVIGHNAYSVMDCLDGVDGIVYAYQKEQKGTGHAALCGLKVLETMGYEGSVIISMGDKIIASHVIAELIDQAANGSKAVWGVQPLAANPNGGRVVTADGIPYGVVEFADAAQMMLAGAEPATYEEILRKLGLNEKKAKKVIANTLVNAPQARRELCGKVFNAEEILYSAYANAGLYCLDLYEAVKTIRSLGSENAQGEIYLTDALEHFARDGMASIYEVRSDDDMLTFSTKHELCEISRKFMRTASEFIADISEGKLDHIFNTLYRENATAQKKRYVDLLQLFISLYEDHPVVITRAPGRINLMGRHIDHRGGSINVMATDKDTVFITSARTDDTVNIANMNPVFPKHSFSISKELGSEQYDSWLNYLEAETTVRNLLQSCGDWSNYVKSAVLRAQFDNSVPLCGMDMVSDGSIPIAAGLSSSSSIVVAVMEAVNALNCLELPNRRFIELCGEGEWFVGSRGGAGDHAAMKCGQTDSIVHLSFKPFAVGKTASFSDRYAVVVANSMLMAKKSEGSKDTFNAKVAAYEISLMLLKRYYPAENLTEFRDIATIKPYSKIYKMLQDLPEKASRKQICNLLPELDEELHRIFTTHKDPSVYDLRGVTLYGISECIRAERTMELLDKGEYEELGRLMKISHDGDRLGNRPIEDWYLEYLEENNSDPAYETGDYGCSVKQIDELCDLLNGTDGVLGSELVGAGLGGCVIALVEKTKSTDVIKKLNEKYYDKYGYAHAANVFTASHGSCVLF